MSPSGDIGVLTTDVSLVVQSWDDWLSSVTSIAPEDARGRTLAELVPGLEERGLMQRFRQTLATGAVQVFTSSLNGPLIPCAPRQRSQHFELMQQRVTVGPLLEGERMVGVVITIQDVTAQLDAERDLAAALMSGDVDERRAAVDAIAGARRVESPESFSPALRSGDWRVRRAAVDALAAAADEDLLRAVLDTLQREHRDFSTLSSALKLLAVTDQDITAPLTELLRHADVDLRMQAALALGAQHHPSAVPPLLAALDDPDPNVRFHAIEALGRLRAGAAAEPLLAIAESGDFFLGFAALEALAAIGDARVAPRLVALIRSEAFREPAARALSQLGDERVVAPLVSALNESPAAAIAAATALASIADRLSRESLDLSALVRASLTDEGRRHLLAAAREAPPDAAVSLARALRWIGGPEASEALGSLLAMGHVRAEAAAALVDIGEPAVDILIGRLDDEDDEVRAAAIGALGQIGSRRATPHLVKLLEEPRMAIAASGALARVADRDAFEPLLGLIGHGDAAIRMAAVGALNAIGHPQLQERILALLDHQDPLVRESAVRIAGYFGHAKAAEHVLARATDPDEAVRVAALEHLPFFDEASAFEVLAEAVAQGTPKTRAAAVRALARLESPAVLRLLAEALADPDAWVRYFAARAIGERPERTELPVLGTIAESDPSTPVRIAAIQAIGERRVPVPLEPLIAAAASDNLDVAAAALVALGRLDCPEAMTALQSAARAPEAPRRKAAAEALAVCASRDAIAELEWMAAADADPTVAECAIRELGAIASAGGEQAPHAVDSLVELLAEAERCEAVTAVIARLPVAIVARVGTALTHPQPTVRRRAIDALARYRYPDATRLIAPAFDDPEAAVREAAASAVLRLGTRFFDEALRRLAAEDPSEGVRRLAVAALSALRATD